MLLAAGLTLVASAYVVGRNEPLFLGCFLALAPLIAVATVRLRRMRIHTTRRFSPHLPTARHRLDVALTVTNRAPARTGQARWRDTLPWPARGASGILPPLAPHRVARGTGASATIEYSVTPPRRGITEIGPLLVDFPDPFGLALGEIEVGETHSVVVAPAVARFPDLGRRVAADEGAARAHQLRASTNDDELMTREYRAGDPLRRVHWKASARHGELMVRQEEQRSHARARIVLDTRRGGYRDVQRATATEPESESFEWLVSFTASLSQRLTLTGYTVDVTETAWPQLRHTDQRDELLEGLATIELRDEPRRENQLGLRPDPGRTLGNIFALVSDAEPHIVDELAANRVHYDQAVAFVVAARREAVAEPLARAGFTCVELLPDDGPVEAWLAVAHLAEEVGSRA